MNNKLLLCISLALGTSFASDLQAAAPTVEVYENRCVASIDIQVENLPEGATFDPRPILSKLRTQVGDPFSQYIFDQDLKTLATDYDRVDPYASVDGDDVHITLKVWLRPKINEIAWEGNEHVPTGTLRKQLDIKPGTIFNRTDFNTAFNKVKEYYIKKGYFESQLQYRVIPRGKNEVEILISVDEGRSGKIDDIVFNGFSKEEESAVLHQLYTKKHHLLTSWFTGVGKFNEEALEQDQMQISNYLQDQGYADARVHINIVESPKKGKIIVEISTEKGALYHFGRVTFDGNHLFTEEEIERVFSARPESVYSPEKLRATAQSIKDLYGRKGRIDASVTYETQLDTRVPIYNVHFQIDEGQEYKIGLIRVIGNIHTQTHVILRESLLVPGETFDSLKLKITQARLEGIGYFKSVNVYAVRTQDDLSLGENYRDVYIEVEEKTTGNISLFTGFSSADNIFGGIDLTETNFNGKGIMHVPSKGIWAIRGGGEYLHMRASFGARQQNFLLSWMTPYFQDTLWRVGFEFNITPSSTLISDDYDIGTYAFSLFASYPLTPYWTFGTKYRIKNIDIDVDIKDKEFKQQTKDNNGVLSGVGASVTWDSTDSALKPHNGLRSVADAEFVGVGGHVSFLRTAYLNSYYNALSRRGYMRYRWDFRFILPLLWTHHFRDIPLSERYFLGGVSSVRGYKDF
ncbi:MAG: Outer membrane protein assembly factor BamA, partial [Chlamydiae bacterium]|nr:Outer membrane protein assembly factor BamA [Chlamydiota bacterium]